MTEPGTAIPKAANPASNRSGPGDLWIVRHGETEWARLGRHTGRTDVPLTELGREQARELGRRLAGHPFALVITSPLSRAEKTASLAGFGDVAVADSDLMEWDYGSFEGRQTGEIRIDFPGWTIWRGPWPGGETIDQVAARADRIVARVRSAESGGDVLAFGHGHLLRVVAARWLGLEPSEGALFALGTATLSVLGWEHESPVVTTWNEACRVA